MWGLALSQKPITIGEMHNNGVEISFEFPAVWVHLFHMTDKQQGTLHHLGDFWQDVSALSWTTYLHASSIGVGGAEEPSWPGTTWKMLWSSVSQWSCVCGFLFRRYRPRGNADIQSISSIHRFRYVVLMQSFQQTSTTWGWPCLSCFMVAKYWCIC